MVLLAWALAPSVDAKVRRTGDDDLEHPVRHVPPESVPVGALPHPPQISGGEPRRGTSISRAASSSRSVRALLHEENQQREDRPATPRTPYSALNAADRASVPALIGRDIAAKCFHLMRRAERLEPSRRGEFFRLKLCSPDRRSTENGRRSPWAARTATSRTIARSRSRNVPPCALHPLCRGTKSGIYLTSDVCRVQFLRHDSKENISRKLTRGISAITRA